MAGDLLRQVHAKRLPAARRNAIADRVLCTWLSPIAGTPSFHRWLPIPAGRMLLALLTQAAQAGILESALLKLQHILETAEAVSFV